MADAMKTVINVAVDNIQARVEQIEQELIEADNKSNHILYKAAKDVIDSNNKYLDLVTKYNNKAKEYVSLIKAKTKGKTKTEKSNIIANDLGILKAHSAALQTYNDLNTKAVKEQLIDLSKKIHTLQKIVNDYGGVSIGMIYVVNSNGQQVILDISDIPLDQLVTLDRASLARGGQIKLRYDDSAIKNLITTMSDVDKENKIFTSRIAPKLNAFFSEVENRWQYAKQDGHNYILWRFYKEWHKAHITAFGDVQEAYLDVYLNYRSTNNVPHFLQISGYDGQIHYFIHDYVSKVDNTAAGFLEDIQIGNTGQFYGAKSKGASMASVTPYIDFAQSIIDAVDKNKGQFFAQDKKKIIKNYAPKKAKKQRTQISKVVESDKNIQDIRNTIDKIINSHRTVTINIS